MAAPHDRPAPPRSGWVAVRHVIEHTSPDDHLYEERITLWRSATMDEAIELAEAEVAEYCIDLDGVDAGIYQAYLLADDVGPAHSGTEIFSLVRESPLPKDEYLSAFFDTGREMQRPIDEDSTSRPNRPVSEGDSQVHGD